MSTLSVTEQCLPPTAREELASEGFTLIQGVDPLDMNARMEELGLELGSSTNTLGLISLRYSEPLPVHVEGLYHKETTPYFLLGCIAASATGGQTQIYDAREAARIMLEERPDTADIVFEHRSALHPGLRNTTPIIVPHGSEAVLRFCDTPGNNWFVQTPDGFDEAEFYSYARDVLDRSLVHSQDWQPGEIVIVNNDITLHGRSAFDGKRMMLRVRVDDPTRREAC